jgi:chromosome segregation ATPase
MAKTAVATPSLDLEAIDRLEHKLKQLVAVLDRTRADGARAAAELEKARGEQARVNEELTRARTEQARAAEENTRLRAELDATKARVADAEGTGAELSALRTEREQIRSRVDDMLKQIESLNL